MFNTIVGAGAACVMAPAPTKRCGSLRLRLRNTGLNLSSFYKFCLAFCGSRSRIKICTRSQSRIKMMRLRNTDIYYNIRYSESEEKKNVRPYVNFYSLKNFDLLYSRSQSRIKIFVRSRSCIKMMRLCNTSDHTENICDSLQLIVYCMTD
jgi:hypothetical protein